jgi:hypothetical protein
VFLDKDKTMDNVQKHNICHQYGATVDNGQFCMCDEENHSQISLFGLTKLLSNDTTACVLGKGKSKRDATTRI